MPTTAPPAKASVKLRPPTRADAGVIARIYNEGIEDRQATFQTRLHGARDFVERISAGRPFLVAEAGGEVVAWAAVVPYSDRAPYYAGVGEAMLYVTREQRGRGLGTRLLQELAVEAERHGYHKLTGKIFATNAASIALVHRCGFRDVGVHLRHGRLDGEWRDVLLVEKSLDGEAGTTSS